MNPTDILIIVGLVVAAVLTGDFLMRRISWQRRATQARTRAERLLADAAREADNKMKEAQLAAAELKEQLEDEAAQRLQKQQEELERRSERLDEDKARVSKEESRIGRESARLQKTSDNLDSRSAQVEERTAELERQEADVLNRLEKIAGLSREEAITQLREEILSEATRQAEEDVRAAVARARSTMDERISEALNRALQHVRIGGTVESTVSLVRLPSDDMKGRIIGREGRNIRSIEMTTGIDLIVDDTPGTVTLSCFDPLRRETARVAIERLLEDGRIHPARIEELVEKTRKDMEEVIRETGESAAFELAVQDLHPRLTELLGRLKYHTSEGQNLLQHCRETADLAGVLALELGLSADIPRRAGLLHEVAQAADEPPAAATILASGELVVRHGEERAVQEAIAAAHPDVTPHTVEGALVRLACRMSHGRTGARKHNLEVFMGRMRRLEAIAADCEGVKAAFVFRAGKELRVVVDSEKLSDKESAALAKDLANRLRREADLPGDIKVCVLRETRAVDFAL